MIERDTIGNLVGVEINTFSDTDSHWLTSYNNQSAPTVLNIKLL